MKIGWLDGGAGASGDMVLGALVGVGVPLEILQRPLDCLKLGIELRVEATQRAGLGATQVHVDVPRTRTLRHLSDIVELLSSIDEPIRRRALRVFERLARAEARVHGTQIEQVHFHEVGALDSIADIVGAGAGFEWLALDRLYCSTVSLGNGATRGAHGPLPIPVPAVLELMRGVDSVQAGPAPFESTTPTGAALLVDNVDEWGPMPAMTIHRVGVGAGSKDSMDLANALRLVVGASPPG